MPIVDWLRVPAGMTLSAGLPIVLGYFEGGAVLRGCGAILLDDMCDRPHWNPWLGCLYVLPPSRNQGVARRLVVGLIDAASRQGIRCLYLFCAPGLRGFYSSEGWRSIERRSYEGKDVEVMERCNL
jgi:GNAT superfamily N-acetyltransferase